MNRTRFWIASVIVVLLVAFFLVLFFGKQPIRKTGIDYKKATYLIDGQPVKLDHGARHFGDELITDLNNDGRPDVVFLITRDGGGSGTFFYVVAALNTSSGYVGSDGYFLGDRIAPQTITESSNRRQKNVIVVNYADRAPSDPMTTPPSVGKSVYLKLDPETRRWGIVLPDFEGESR